MRLREGTWTEEGRAERDGGGRRLQKRYSISRQRKHPRGVLCWGRCSRSCGPQLAEAQAGEKQQQAGVPQGGVFLEPPPSTPFWMGFANRRLVFVFLGIEDGFLGSPR